MINNRIQTIKNVKMGDLKVGCEKSEIVIDKQYSGYNPVQFGSESCYPGDDFGPFVRTHWLLHYVVYGCGIFERDGVRHEVNSGDIFVIPPYEETYYAADMNKPWRYIWIGFTTEEKEIPVLAEPVIHCPGAGAVFEDMLRCGKMENGRSAFLSGKIWELFGVLMDGGEPNVGYVEKALHCLNSEYMNGVTVQQVADRLNINRSYLSELFKEQMGVSPQTYLINLRLEKAAELLTVYGESPTTAGISVGYPDLYHFSKMFKQHFGMSPRKYREINCFYRKRKTTNPI